METLDKRVNETLAEEIRVLDSTIALNVLESGNISGDDWFDQYKKIDQVNLYSIACRECNKEVLDKYWSKKVLSKSCKSLSVCSKSDLKEIKSILKGQRCEHWNVLDLGCMETVNVGPKYLYDYYKGFRGYLLIGTDISEYLKICELFDMVLPDKVRCFIIPYTKWEGSNNARPTSWLKLKICFRIE